MAYPLLLHGCHDRGEITYQTFGEWVVPWRFTSLEAEYETLRAAAGLMDYSSQAFIQVGGADRSSFLHSLLTNHIKRLAPGGGCRSALLAPNAKILADMLVLADADRLWLITDAARAGVVAENLERYHFSEAVTIANHERAQAVFTVEGPRSTAVMEAILGRTLALDNPLDHSLFSLEGMELRIIRHSPAGGNGLLCCVAAQSAVQLWETLRSRGKPLGLSPVGWEAFNTVRIEAGVPFFGIDMTEENLLSETALEGQLASDSKGCYVGQEIVARLATYGSVSKKLVRLRIPGSSVPQANDPVLREGEEIGRVTSACYSPGLKQVVALAYLKRGFYEAAAGYARFGDGL